VQFNLFCFSRRMLLYIQIVNGTSGLRPSALFPVNVSHMSRYTSVVNGEILYFLYFRHKKGNIVFPLFILCRAWHRTSFIYHVKGEVFMSLVVTHTSVRTSERKQLLRYVKWRKLVFGQIDIFVHNFKENRNMSTNFDECHKCDILREFFRWGTRCCTWKDGRTDKTKSPVDNRSAKTPKNLNLNCTLEVNYSRYRWAH
jgi:hypothetical protein